MADARSPAVKPFYYVATVIWYIFTVIEVLLLFRIGLKLVGANPSAGFTQFMYGITSGLVDPFIRIVSPTAAGPGVIEWSAVIAVLVYWALAWIIVRLFLMTRPISSGEAAHRLDKLEGSDVSETKRTETASGIHAHEHEHAAGYHSHEHTGGHHAHGV